MAKKKKVWNGEKIFSTVAICISLLTLLVFTYQTRLIQKQQYMSVLPYLAIKNVQNGSLNYHVLLENEGLGPAIIKNVSVSKSDGTKYNSLKEYVYESIKNDTMSIYHSDIYLGLLIPEKESIPIFGLMTEELTKGYQIEENINTIASAKRLTEVLNDTTLVWSITYESIHGEEWTISNRSSIPTKK